MLHLNLYNQDYEILYREFLSMTKSKGYSAALYMASVIREFLFHMESKGISDIKLIKAKDVITHYEYLRERPNQRRQGTLSDSVIKHHLFSLRCFFDYLLETGQIENSPLRISKFALQGSSLQRNVLTLEEIKLIYTACESLFDRALLALAYGCGLRRSEIEQLNFGDVNFYKAQLTVRVGKFGKSRTLALSDKVSGDLKNYFFNERAELAAYFSHTFCPAFLLNNKGHRTSGQVLNLRVKHLIAKTDNQSLLAKNITLHSLRHSIATHLLDQGAGMEFVQGFLGHTLLDTTHIYCSRRKQRSFYNTSNHSL